VELRRVLSRLEGEELPTPRAALAAALGVIAVKDLMVNDVPRALVAGPQDLHLPFFRVPVLPPCDASSGACFLLLVAGFIAGIALIAGRFARPAAAFLALLYAWAFASDQLAYTNNVFLFIVLLSVVALEPLDPSRPAPAYPTWIVRLLVTAIYGVGAIVKMSPQWLSGRILGEAFLHYHFVYAGALGYRVQTAFAALAIASLLVEASLAVLLWVPRAREKIAVVGCLFHASIEVLLPVRIFSFLMMASYLVFLPPERLEVFRRWRARSTIRAAAAGIRTAVGINVVLAWLVRSQDLPPKNQIALVLACIAAAGAWALFPALRVPGGDARPVVPRALRIPLVAALAALEIFCVVKPAFGFTNRFGWRMFTEVLQMRITTTVREGGAMRPYEPDGRWSTGDLRYHWDSLSEQLAQLDCYARWILAHEPAATEVRIDVTWERNGAPGTRTIVASRDGG
jgi:hypothetical protein